MSEKDKNIDYFIQLLKGFSDQQFDPLTLVRVVNILRRENEEHVFEILKGYLSGTHSSLSRWNAENVLLVARVLYTLKQPGEPGYKKLILGLSDIKEPEDQGTFPIFPLALISDIPFLLTGGYLAGGQAMSPLEYLDWCAVYCQLRQKELVPADDPLEAADVFLRSPAWLSLEPAGLNFTLIRLQALRMVSDVYHANIIWEQCLKEFKVLSVYWEPSTQRYSLKK